MEMNGGHRDARAGVLQPSRGDRNVTVLKELSITGRCRELLAFIPTVPKTLFSSSSLNDKSARKRCLSSEVAV